MSEKSAGISASKAANIIRILSDKKNRDERFVNWVAERIARSKPW